MNFPVKWIRNIYTLCSPFYIMDPAQRWRSYSVHTNHRIGINHEYRFVFVRIPKNASTVISLSLHHNITGEKIDSASEAKKIAFKTPTSLGFGRAREVLAGYYKFCFVRNPFTRILSAYLQKISRGQGGRKAKYKKMICKRLGVNTDNEIYFTDFIRYLEQGGLMDDPHWIPQSCYIDMIGFNQLDFAGKVENLVPDLKNLYERIFGADNFILPDFKKKVTGAKDLLQEYYRPEERQAIKRLYSQDFEIFESIQYRP
ncbi:sulfotransferase family protein [Desulfonatronospira sp.]|uniref:sulfotransferase family protein n=1 Tax=Desulfonatronospira sp. TaxID=1962951 RepID=UPI0025BC5992|nr:sulfotransferase family protein [Desulfonatronospira sp.]